MKPSPKLTAILRRSLLAAASLVTLLAVGIAFENWRGDRAWAAVERDLKAKGQLADAFAAVTPPLSDDRNFLKTPQLAALLYCDRDAYSGTVRSGAAMRLIARLIKLNLKEILSHDSVDFEAARKKLEYAKFLSGPATASPPADALRGLQEFAPLFEEMRRAAHERLDALLDPMTPQGNHDFDASMAARLGQLLAFRASAELALGRPDDAFGDLFTLQRFASSLCAQPRSLVQLLVGVSLHRLAANAITAGRQQHIWTESHLAQLQSQLEKFNPLAAFREAMQTEQTQALSLVDARPAAIFVADGVGWPGWLFRGWAQQNKVAFCRHLENDVLPAFASDPQRIFPERLARLTVIFGRGSTEHSRAELLSQMTLQNIASILGGVGSSAEQLELASVACALERHRLAHGSYPEKLDELVPAFLPAVLLGVFDGQPSRYTPLPEGGRQLFSFGPNGRDDGGRGDDIVLKLRDAL